MKTYINYLNENKKINYNELSEASQILIVSSEGYYIQFIDKPSEKVQLAAVKNWPYVLKFDCMKKYATDRVKKEALKINGVVIRYINEPTEEMKYLAVKSAPSVIEDIKNPSTDLKVLAITLDDRLIHQYPELTQDIDTQMSLIKKDINFLNNFNTLNKVHENIVKYVFDQKKYDILEIFFNNPQNQKLYENLINKEFYYKAPKDFPWIPEIKNKFKDIDRFKRFNL